MKILIQLLGKVVDLHPGADGVVKVVTLKTEKRYQKADSQAMRP